MLQLAQSRAAEKRVEGYGDDLLRQWRDKDRCIVSGWPCYWASRMGFVGLNQQETERAIDRLRTDPEGYQTPFDAAMTWLGIRYFEQERQKGVAGGSIDGANAG